MAELPTGVITFLFTDIEGSTRLWEEDPRTMGEALARHDALLRRVIEEHEGLVFKTLGDAFCAAFARAADALRAALRAQRQLQAEEWPTAQPLRVRMALHTGAAQRRGGDYFGTSLNRTARLLAIGHGAQVLLSADACQALHDALPPEGRLLDQGSHRLKDLQQPERVYQLSHPDLPAGFPPLRSLQLFANNLPQQVTPFIGREQEMDALKALLAGNRLLTLTGIGGGGKTRLSLQLAADLIEQHPDGVWLVELAALTDPERVVPAAAGVLGLREEPHQPLLDTLLDHLQTRQALLILDNCEHLLEASARLAQAVLARCPRVRLLASSREGLRIEGEVVSQVPSLSLPPAPGAVEGAGDDPGRAPEGGVEELLGYEAIQLFVERARAVRPDFALTPVHAPWVSQICRRLDGIPLAIELAAARVRAMSPQRIAERLDDRFRLLTGGRRTALPRQQTLKALIDWSWDLLSEQERTVLRRLSVFAGGWTLEAAEAVCADARSAPAEERGSAAAPCGPLPPDTILDVLVSLVEKSLVLYDDDDQREDRYRLLETVREYAGERLAESGDVEAARGRHRSYWLRWAEAAAQALSGGGQARWLDRIEREHDNLRAALAGAVGSEEGLRLAVALGRFWSVRGHFSEGRRWLGRALAATPGAAPALRAAALLSAGSLARYQGDYDEARAQMEASLTLHRQIDDPWGVADSLSSLSVLAADQDRYPQARAHLQESLAIRRRLGDRQGIAAALGMLGLLAQHQHDEEDARRLFEESLTLHRAVSDRRGIAISLHNLANLAARRGDRDAARALYQESLAIKRELGDQRGIAAALHKLGDLAREAADLEQARALYQEALSINREIGNRQWESNNLDSLGALALAQDDRAAAHAWLAASLRIRHQLEDQWGIASSLEMFAHLEVGRRSRWRRAAVLLAAAETLREAIQVPALPRVREAHARYLAALRMALGDDILKQAQREGRRMTVEHAVRYALEE